MTSRHNRRRRHRAHKRRAAVRAKWRRMVEGLRVPLTLGAALLDSLIAQSGGYPTERRTE